ncbi:hypothetical protein GDO78_016099 [Eleutherodactylus coqui]|uniref:GIY-YIG domain-containing protein n=1 Tax=Eleutherodactylus coqui TaxID=57060 RepID=A0A8J6E8E1_ELECQ|nr:hypothetical protein GDO78_016099 [Eleutherodactylus coqui]
MFITTASTFVNPVDSKIYQIKQEITCHSTAIICGVRCPCPKIYIGKTVQELRRNISKHLSSIHMNMDTPLQGMLMEVLVLN